MSELMVHIRDFKTPISVSKVENGIEVGKREVLVDDYIRSLLESLNDEELLGFLISADFREIIEKYLNDEDSDNDIYSNIFSIILNNCKSRSSKEIKNHDLFTKLFTLMLEKVNVKEVNEDLLSDLLQAILKNVDSAKVKDMVIYNKLFKVLLEKVNISKGSSLVVRDFLEVLLNRLKNPDNKEDLKGIFDLIVEKSAEAQWVEEVIRKRKPQTTAHKTPILPQGTVSYKESVGGLKTIIIETQKHQRDVQFKDLHYKEVGHPKLLFVYQVLGKQIQNMMIFARDEKPLSEDSVLYHYPYSHVYDNGKVCWGFRSEVINSLDQLTILTKVFLETPNNHDLSRKGSVERLVKLQRKEFDDELLEPTNLTFKKLVDLI